MKILFVVSVLVVACACRHHQRLQPQVPPSVTPSSVQDTSISEPKAKPAERVTVIERPAHKEIDSTPAVAPSLPDPRIVQSQLADIFFAYDRADLSTEAVTAAERNARVLAPFLKAFPEVRVKLEGHCDERGSAEYNLALGALRASRLAAALTELGVPAQNLETVSYGKEMPQCMEPEESCWSRNRRAHIVILPR